MSGERFEVDRVAQRDGHAFEQENRAQGKPAVALEFSTAWCPRHLEPYRAEWPKGAAVAMLRLFEAFTADERAQRMAGGDAMRLAAVVAECSPLCCFVGDAVVARIHAETGVAA